MSKRRRVVSTRIAVSHRSAGSWFLVVVLILALVAGAFWIGVFLAREETKSFRETVQVFEKEKNRLSEQLSELKQERVVLERTILIDREANRTAQEHLKAAQDERLDLEKEVSFLRRLIREGGGGLLKVHDFLLTSAEGDRMFKYRFTVSQMIQGFGESVGSVVIKLAGERDGKEVMLGLVELADSVPRTHKMRFKHFQNIEGTLAIPEGLDPKALLIEVKPTTKKLIPVTETFSWNPGG